MKIMSFVKCKFNPLDPAKNLDLICDYCHEPLLGEMICNMICIKEGTNETMHFCNYDHIAKYYACKNLQR